MAWTPFTVAAPTGADLPDDVVAYGPHIPGERSLKLLGDLSGKRVLDLGCGAGSNAIAMARAGARVIAVDEDADQIGAARRAIDAADVKVELHHAPLAELAFLRAETIDAAISVHSLVRVPDIGRVFRQLHRVLRQEHHFVLSVPHPIFALLDPDDPEPLIRRSAFDEQPYAHDDPRHGTHARSAGELFTELGRAGFRVDHLLEPAPTGSTGGPHWSAAMAKVPATLILRARKEGI
jgi:ubiquinone/menaquinone biosynthesis C-methylase UbiE